MFGKLQCVTSCRPCSERGVIGDGTRLGLIDHLFLGQAHVEHLMCVRHSARHEEHTVSKRGTQCLLLKVHDHQMMEDSLSDEQRPPKGFEKGSDLTRVWGLNQSNWYLHGMQVLIHFLI